ncbi:sulfotransferase 1B1 [Patella vulgata]|uniref:sulfotransferase 1B1 n=1 Tax=Patella vulgata TaxID=6465 RepID=UPI0021808E92|nr:sulfotransferase 1B1 [Patella vulgata]
MCRTKLFSALNLSPGCFINRFLTSKCYLSVGRRLSSFHQGNVLIHDTYLTHKNQCFIKRRLLQNTSLLLLDHKTGKLLPNLPIVNIKRFVSHQQTTDQNRKRILTYATYFSCAIGAVLLTVVGAKEYKKLTRRARGIEKIAEPLLGRRKYLYKYRGYIYDEYIVDHVDKIHHFQIREDDVWVLSYPKAGTTWMEEIVYLIMNDLDIVKARSKIIEERIPFFEYAYPGFKAVTAMESPRIIKSHLPMSFLPKQIKDKKPKIVYVARNAKDTVVSFYHFFKMLKLINYSGNLNDFVDGFLDDKIIYSPWSKHVLEAWKIKDEENILFIKYEDMKKDISSVIQQLSLFLNRPLTDQQIKLIVECTKFDAMKNNPASNYSWMKGWGIKDDKEFLRKGIIGDWKNELTTDQIESIDKMVDTKLGNSSLVFEDK